MLAIVQAVLRLTPKDDAVGYAKASGLPLEYGLYKNPYAGRTGAPVGVVDEVSGPA